MQLFSEFVKERAEKARSKIHHLFQYLETREDMAVELHVVNEEPYIFIKTNPGTVAFKKLEGLGLGVKIFDVGSKLVFRLQHKPKGQAIGPSNIIEDHDRIRKEIEGGKDEDQAYNEMFARVPDLVLDFMKKVFENIHKRVEGSPVNQDVEKEREIINSIVASA